MKITNYEKAEKELLKKGYYIKAVLERAEENAKINGCFGETNFDYELGKNNNGAMEFAYFDLVKPETWVLENENGEQVICCSNDKKLNSYFENGYEFIDVEDEALYEVRI